MDVIYILCLLFAFSLSPQRAVSSSSPALYVSPLLSANRSAEARSRSAVAPSLFLNVTSHAGYLTVDQRYNSNTFFWYFPVAGQPVDKTPWIIWLQGGPGASSLAGLFDEIGPFQYRNGTLTMREWAWSKNYSMVFIDNPVGAGFSFTTDDRGFATNYTTYGSHLWSAVQQLVQLFPELRAAPLFVAGESYAGHFVPALARNILEHAAAPATNASGENINLQGIMLGNPILNREHVSNLTAMFYALGLIDVQGAIAVSPLQHQYTDAVRKGDAKTAYKLRDALLDRLEELSQLRQEYNFLVDEYELRGFEQFLRRPEVRSALHVGDLPFTFDNVTVHKKLVDDFLVDVDTDVEKLLEHCRVLIYCGQLDLAAPCAMSSEPRRRWRWSRRDEFLAAPRRPWTYNDSVAGYVKSGGGLAEALVRGAGHLVPIDRPAQAHQLVAHFIQGRDLPMLPLYKPNLRDTPPIPEVDELSVVPHRPPATTNSSETTSQSSTDDSSTKAGMIVSVVVNVALLALVCAGGVAYCRLRRKTQDFFYSSVDNISDDIFLT